MKRTDSLIFQKNVAKCFAEHGATAAQKLFNLNLYDLHCTCSLFIHGIIKENQSLTQLRAACRRYFDACQVMNSTAPS